MILVGELSLWVALLMATWAATVSFTGGALRRRDLTLSGERAIYATLAMVVLASAGLWTALFTHDFSIRYVASFSSANLPKVYTFTAFWAGQSGSMLFWCLILAAYSSLAVYSNRARKHELMPYVSGTLAVVMIFFLAMMCFGANPFERLDWIPPDGRGMNPQLQNPGMAIHPPTLYLGYVGTTIPFAFVIAALITRRLDAEWLTAIRKWTLVSWFFNTTGIVLGMWWAYVELGWGGYWAWDPVENVSLLPWLVNTAFLHSIMVQEKRGMLRKWNVTLVASTFLLSIFGTFITRSGIISSVHSFAQSPVGNWFAGFLLLSIAITAYLVTTRLKDLEAKASLESMVSREAAFLYNNVVLVGIAFSVLWGTLFPIITEAVRGEKITVGPPFFNAVNIPLGLALLLLMGIGPLIAWRRASVANLQRQLAGPVLAGLTTGFVLLLFGMRDFTAILAYTFAGFVAMTVTQEFYKGVGARRRMYGESLVPALARLVARNRRQYGGYIVHMGIVVIFAGFAGLAFKKEFDVTLKAGDSKELTDPFGHKWRFVSQGLSAYDILNRQVTALVLDLTRDGKSAGVLTTEKRQYVDSRGAPTFGPSTEVGIRESWREDVYVVLAGVGEDESAEIRITFNPLVRWVWLGGALMAIGGLVVMWPQVQRRRVESGYAAVMAPIEAPVTERELAGATAAELEKLQAAVRDDS
ncbi:MAG: heme lyase CcmF/NrfE family subunit [Gemmatimonadaceae bacterium]|nr:heme lyase CcmF/NrfE family subunit [Gemmatimonadaceae bacterium]